MMEDIVPSLLKKIKSEFEGARLDSEVLKDLLSKLHHNKASYLDANQYAIEIGEILSKALGASLTNETLPDGKMYYNIAQRVLMDVLGRNHELVSDYAEQVQKNLNSEARIGLTAQVPELNQDRIDGLVNRFSSEDNFEDVSWLLGEPIVNFTQSIIDDSIRKNAEFHAEVGLSPKIVRTTVGNCCKWCQKLAGSYVYPNVPHDVYRRHQNCRCIVNYKTSDGKRQNIWTKRIVKPVNSDIIEMRKNLNLKVNYDTSRYPHNADGTVKVSRIVERKIPADVSPFEVIDVVNNDGVVSRTFIDEYGRRGMRIDTSDHKQPKYHPMGAHKHIMEYDDEGNYVTDGKPLVLSPNDRKENKDIL
ncbi:hypothetical protein [Streptococcus sp.]|uniref:hypothetical protein n=1 Tax=Streptococcus sp. TaxID=1306 RepID=UPI0025B0259B|nr:hypothetical protein [Streptococcus sp.]MDN3290899.1 hypothetical protein [Streptococcus sp.]